MINQGKTRHPLISASRLTLGYGSHVVFGDLSFTIHDGDLLGLVGPNGGGKTTIMRAILGSLEPRAGEIVRHTSNIHFGYVPQRQQLDPMWPLRAVDIVVMGTYGRIGIFRRPGSEQTDAALEALEHVGIRDLADERYSDLSGGQKQRTLMARALAAQPNFLILDEPTQGMDLSSSTSILKLIDRLHRDGITILIASHRLNVVANYVEELALVRDGKVHIGPRDELLTTDGLTALYGIPVEVIREADGRIVVLGG